MQQRGFSRGYVWMTAGLLVLTVAGHFLGRRSSRAARAITPPGVSTSVPTAPVGATKRGAGLGLRYPPCKVRCGEPRTGSSAS